MLSDPWRRGPCSGTQWWAMYTTRLQNLRNSLAERYGNEILFAGSGGIFEYADRAAASRNLHRKFQVLPRKPGTTRLRR